ncbi:hypothetical protein H5T55_07810 [Candidatus Bipolaricaulota bacterium]|nr:hypothetical protein [Candidatus Bipolaricaulota bacterium]
MDKKIAIAGVSLGIILLIVALAAMPPKTTDSKVSEPQTENKTLVNIAINWLVENGYITRDEVEDYFVDDLTDALPKYGIIWTVTISVSDANYWVYIAEESGEVLHVDRETERGFVEVYSILTPEEKEELGLVPTEEEEESYEW